MPQYTLTGDQKPTKLINIKHHDHTDVHKIGRSTKYGNPYKLTKDGGNYTLEESLEHFYEYWYADEQADLRAAAREELTGETLGCYCVEEPLTVVTDEPTQCHGEVILQWVNNTADGDRP